MDFILMDAQLWILFAREVVGLSGTNILLLLVGVIKNSPTVCCQAAVRPRSSSAGTIRIVLVLPMPPRQPWTQMTASPFDRTPSLTAFEIPHLSRLSTSICHSTLLKSGFGSSNKNGYTPRYRWAYLAAVGLRVTMMIGHMGRYFESKRAEWPL